MTTITHTADGPRFDGMTVKSLADDLHQMAMRFADRGFSASSYMTMEAAVAALRHLSEWQPIETAPKDSTYVMVALPSGHVTMAQYCADNYWRHNPHDDYGCEPTHWRPLPPGPDGGGA